MSVKATSNEPRGPFVTILLSKGPHKSFGREEPAGGLSTHDPVRVFYSRTLLPMEEERESCCFWLPV